MRKMTYEDLQERNEEIEEGIEELKKKMREIRPDINLELADWMKLEEQSREQIRTAKILLKLHAVNLALAEEQIKALGHETAPERNERIKKESAEQRKRLQETSTASQ